VNIKSFHLCEGAAAELAEAEESCGKHDDSTASKVKLSRSAASQKAREMSSTRASLQNRTWTCIRKSEASIGDGRHEGDHQRSPLKTQDLSNGTS
jgi:hypothetical protein